MKSENTILEKREPYYYYEWDYVSFITWLLGCPMQKDAIHSTTYYKCRYYTTCGAKLVNKRTLRFNGGTQFLLIFQ
jgi:hypothetical protein